MVADDEMALSPSRRRMVAKARTRAKVLEAGRKLFIAHGSERSLIRDIAIEAGMSTGAVFANFRSKNELLLVVARQELEPHQDILRRAGVGDDAIVDRIVRVCAADYVFFCGRLRLMESVAQLETDAVDEMRTTARLLTEQRRGLIRAVIGDLLRSDELRDDAAIGARTAIVAAVHVDRCRQAAIDGLSPETYQPLMKELLSSLFAPIPFA